MKYLLMLILAMGVSLVAIPLLARIAPRLRLVDLPNARKVHEVPIPRVGGLGVVGGVLLTVILWAPHYDPVVLAYLTGVFTLLVVGIVDDRGSLPPGTKFLGQIVAVLPMLFYADLYVVHFPFLKGYQLPAAIGIPFTLVAVTGVVNAINTSDGLDGLAGGEVMISLFGISALAFAVKADVLLVIAAATMGGLVGFLRYNTQPARIFMGDAGSQFLGFAAAFLVVYLTQSVNTRLPPAIVLLLLGLPIMDLLVVAIRRLRRGTSPFAPDKDHLHHRLLRLGFTHQRTVVLVYSVQTLMVVSGVALRNFGDWAHVLAYALLSAATFGLVSLAERLGWHASQAPNLMRVLTLGANGNGGKAGVAVWGPRRMLAVAIPLYFIAAVVIADPLPYEFGVLGVSAAMLLLLRYALTGRSALIVQRIAIYALVGAVAFILSYYANINDLLPRRLEQGYLVMVAFALAAAIKLSPRRRTEEFLATPLDYLLGMVLLVVAAASEQLALDRQIAGLIVRVILMLYACELMIIERKEGVDVFGIGCLIAAVALGVKVL